MVLKFFFGMIQFDDSNPYLKTTGQNNILIPRIEHGETSANQYVKKLPGLPVFDSWIPPSITGTQGGRLHPWCLPTCSLASPIDSMVSLCKGCLVYGVNVGILFFRHCARHSSPKLATRWGSFVWKTQKMVCLQRFILKPKRKDSII